MNLIEMAVLRINVICFRCNREINKAEALPVKSATNVPRYQCYTCYKKNKISVWSQSNKVSQKKELFCARCRYKFLSKTNVCPYCNKTDLVGEANVTVSDLL